MFLDLLTTCFFGITGVLLLGVAAMLVLSGYRRTEAVTDVLSALFIRIALPCLVFANMADHFSLSGAPYWWLFPLMGIALFAVGGAVAWLYLSFDGSIRRRGVFMASVIFYNSIMLPLAIAPVLFEGERLASFYNHLFLFNLLTIPAFFSAGLWIIHSSPETRFNLWKAVNPPNIAMALGILCALTGLHDRFIPDRAMTYMRMFGSLSSPLSILIVGGVLISGFRGFSPTDLGAPLKIVLLKSLVIPCAAVAFVYLVRPPETVSLFILLGASMPVGSTIAAVIPREDDIQRLAAGALVFTFLASIIAVPLCMSLWGVLYGVGS